MSHSGRGRRSQKKDEDPRKHDELTLPDPSNTAELDLHLAQHVAEAARKAAENLVSQGIASEAVADGTDLHAKIGRYHCIVRNRVTPGPPGMKQLVEDAYVNLVVRSILDAGENKGSSK